MKKIFEYTEYRDFVADWVAAQAGRGHFKKIATHLKVHSTLMSHFIRGKQNLSEDQASQLAEYMGLNELEAEYFLCLVRMARAGTPRLKQRILNQIERLQEETLNIKNRVPSHEALSQEDAARFYSNWHYSALRLLSDIPAFQTRERLLGALQIPREAANDALTFLLEKGLCIEVGNKIKIGSKRTHLSKNSPYIWNLHRNWRLQGLEKFGNTKREDFFFTAPMSIGAKDIKRIRTLLAQAIEECTHIAAQSPPEKLVCLNLDWFELLSGES